MYGARNARSRDHVGWAGALALVALGFNGCSDKAGGSTFATDENGGADGVRAADGGGSSDFGATGLLHIDGSLGNPAGNDPTEAGNGIGPGCASLSGVVYTPGQTDPLYNAIVYVPKGDIQPIASGATCDKCGGSDAPAVAATLTGADGKFKLLGVPAGAHVPLVVQLGKWRRVVSVNVTGCEDVTLPGELTRLPKDQTEGNIPLTAISTGGADSLECILRKMGVADQEFTPAFGAGRIRMYRATGAWAPGGTSPEAAELWGDLANLEKYDVVLLPCEGEASDEGKTQGYKNLADYTAGGGRAFITHYNYTWIRSPDSAFPATATWTDETKYFGDNYDFPMQAEVNVSFPKGRDFAQWLVNVGASNTLGTIVLNHVIRNTDAVLPDVAEAWLTSAVEPRPYSPSAPPIAQQILHHYTFNTPVGAPPKNQCGRVVYSAFHVNDANSSDSTFPAECDTGPMTPQEKVLMFMLLDLASCVQTDTTPPAPPAIVN